MRALPALLCLALCARGASAQTVPKAPPSDEVTPPAKDAPPGSLDVPPAPPKATDCSRGCLRAESQGGGDGHYWAQGFVDFQAGELRIQCDRFDLYETTAEDGTQQRRVVAEGNVVFMRGEERLSGQHLEMDLVADTAVLQDARGFVSPDVFVEARRIERVDSRTYRIEGGRFTSCYQPTPRWSFSASKATLKRDDRITASGVFFRIKSVPALYLPYFYYPIRDDNRATGFLFPHFGFSSYRGFNVGSGFFWAMGRSADQTFSVDSYSRFGIGYGHELRYVGSGPSNGVFQTTIFDRSDVDQRDYDVNWNAVQALPAGFRSSVSARLFSSTAFQRRLQDTLDLASTRNQRAVVAVSGRIGKEAVQLVADRNETFYGDDQSRLIERLPSLRVSRSPGRIGRTGIVLGYKVSAERLSKGDQEGSSPYERFDVLPTLSRPWGTTFMQVNPSVSYRFTRWGTSREDGELVGDAIDRSLFETNLEMRGPNFAKVFSLGNFYSPRYKHEIGPEFVFTYRNAVDVFDRIPAFDGDDQLLGTNQLRYGLVQKLLAKRPTAGGRLGTHELLFWRLSQTYFGQIDRNQNEYDPNFSSAFFSPDGEPSHYSPVASRLRFRPTREVGATWDFEYDVNFKQLRTMSVAVDMGLPRAAVQAGWSKALRVTADPEARVPVRNTLRAAAQLKLIPDSVDLSGAADYDFVSDKLIRWSGRARLGMQCCALLVELINFDYNDRTERQFRFALELANIGSFGFDGAGPQGLR